MTRIKASPRGKAKAVFYNELKRLIADCGEKPSMAHLRLGRFVASNGRVISNAVLHIGIFQTEDELRLEEARLRTRSDRIEQLEAELAKLRGER